MATIHPHIPAFIDTDRPSSLEFSSIEELLEFDFVKRKRTADDNFHQFSISFYPGHPGFGTRLMAEYNEGYTWWVVGRIEGDDFEKMNTLPQWEAKEKKS